MRLPSQKTALIALAVLAHTVSSALTPATVDSNADSWLYVMQVNNGSLTTKTGSTGTVVINSKKALCFTDRLAHQSDNVSVIEALRELGWKKDGSLGDRMRRSRLKTHQHNPLN